MKKSLIICVFCIPVQLFANPMFGPNTRNTFGIHIGQSTSHGDLGHLIFPWDWHISPMTIFILQYSQPTSVFRLPSRLNLSLLQNLAYHSNDGASFGAIGISLDTVWLSWCDWYIGIGLGPYMRDSGDRYVESRLVFGEKIFIGTRITDRINAELFTLHFSNGDFTRPNHGFNFIGLSVNYSF